MSNTETETLTKQYALLGMTCVSCADSAEKALRQTPGVRDAKVYFATQKVDITFDGTAPPFTASEKALKSLGFSLIADKGQIEKAEADFMRGLRLKLLVAALFSSAIVLLAMVLPHFEGSGWVQLVLTLPVLVYSGGSFFSSAVKQARQGSWSMDTLVALGTGSAFALSVWMAATGASHHLYFESAAVIIAFILVGKYLEETAKSASNLAIEGLAELTPEFTTKIVGEDRVKTAVKDLKPGDLLYIDINDRIPVDGVLTSAEASVDESILTGESMPAQKWRNENVMAGTVNYSPNSKLSRPFEMRVTQTGEQTILAQMMKQIETAQSGKAPAQRLADRISQVFVPIMLGLAILSFIGWYLYSGDFYKAAETALTVLVISCPCALGLATPIAMKVAIGSAYKKKVLIKSAAALEAAATINAIVFDKTGTLISGNREITKFHWVNGAETAENRRLLFNAASISQHPVSMELARYLGSFELSPEKPDAHTESAGKGVKALMGDHTVLIGSRDWLVENGADVSALPTTPGMFSAVFGAIDGKGVAAAFIANELGGATAVVGALKAKGILTVMATGDNESAANAVGKTSGIDRIFARQMPQDKANLIKNLQAEGKKVMFVGDGVNDAVAFAQADVSVAMGAGAAIAIENADIVLLDSRLDSVLEVVRIAPKAANIVKQNLFWAFFYNLMALPLAMGLLPFTIPPMWAGAAMALSSLTVILNSLRLK